MNPIRTNFTADQTDTLSKELADFGTIGHEWLMIKGSKEEGYYLTTTAKPTGWWARFTLIFYKPLNIRKDRVFELFFQFKQQIAKMSSNEKLETALNYVLDKALENKSLPARVLSKYSASIISQLKEREQVAEKKAQEILQHAERSFTQSLIPIHTSPLTNSKTTLQDLRNAAFRNASREEGDINLLCSDGVLKAHSNILNLFPYFKGATNIKKDSQRQVYATTRIAHLMLDQLYGIEFSTKPSREELLELFYLLKVCDLHEYLNIQRHLSYAFIHPTEIIAAWNFFCQKASNPHAAESTPKIASLEEESKEKFDDQSIESEHKRNLDLGFSLFPKEIRDYLLHRLAEQSNATTELPPEFMSQLEILLNENDAATQALFGTLYLQGTKRDFKKAFNYFQKAAEQNDAYAQFAISTCYLNGLGVEQNKPLAFNNAEASAEQGCLLGQALLGLIYDAGIGIPANRSIGLELIEKSATNGCSMGLLSLGRFHLTINKIKAFELCKESRALGNSDAANTLGWYYDAGIGINKDISKASELYQQSAKEGSPNGMTILGRCFREGFDSIVKNPEKAFDCFTYASEYNNPSAQFNLARCYEEGFGVAANREMALHYYTLSAAAGNTEAQKALKRLVE